MRFASNKTKLAACLGISRTLLYEYCRLPDSPAPCADGRWRVPQFRKFITSHATKVKAPNEAEALKIRKLTLQCERELFEWDTARERTRREVTDALLDGFVCIAQLIRSGLYQMRQELAPTFAGKDARSIYRTWEHRERELFATVVAKLQKKTGAQIDEQDTRPVANVVVPFKQSKNGNGAVERKVATR